MFNPHSEMAHIIQTYTHLTPKRTSVYNYTIYALIHIRKRFCLCLNSELFAGQSLADGAMLYTFFKDFFGTGGFYQKVA